MKTKFVVVLTMCASRPAAARITNSLLKKRLIACANVIPGAESKFWWRGKIETAREVMVIMKADNKNFKRIEKEIKRLHGYEIPEIIALPISSGSKDYLNWIKEI